MEQLMAAPVEEGEQPKSVAQIVAEVLTKEFPSAHSSRLSASRRAYLGTRSSDQGLL
jgi:hypothetical protein